jgi:hypothetical protein
VEEILKGFITPGLAVVGFFLMRLINELQKNTVSNGELSKSMAVMTVKFDGMVQKQRDHGKRLDSHSQKIDECREKFHAVGNDLNALFNVSQLTHAGIKPSLSMKQSPKFSE